MINAFGLTEEQMEVFNSFDLPESITLEEYIKQDIPEGTITTTSYFTDVTVPVHRKAD